MELKNNHFYTCKNDRTFKEVFLEEENSDLLKALLETILKIEIEKIEIKKTELLSGNINIKDKRVDAIIYTNNKKIEIEVNSENKEYLHSRNTAYICNMYQSHTLSGEYYNEETDIIQINLTWGLGKKEKEKREYMIRDEEGERFVKNFKIYEINMDYYSNVWYSKNEEEIEKKKYIIMSCHQMPVIEEFCKDITILHHGTAVLQGDLNKIKKSYGRVNLSVKCDGDVLPLAAQCGLVPETITPDKLTFKIQSEEQAKSLLKMIVDSGMPLVRYELREPSLHEIFVENIEKADKEAGRSDEA